MGHEKKELSAEKGAIVKVKLGHTRKGSEKGCVCAQSRKEEREGTALGGEDLMVCERDDDDDCE